MKEESSSGNLEMNLSDYRNHGRVNIRYMNIDSGSWKIYSEIVSLDITDTTGQDGHPGSTTQLHFPPTGQQQQR